MAGTAVGSEPWNRPKESEERWQLSSGADQLSPEKGRRQEEEGTHDNEKQCLRAESSSKSKVCLSGWLSKCWSLCGPYYNTAPII